MTRQPADPNATVSTALHARLTKQQAATRQDDGILEPPGVHFDRTIGYSAEEAARFTREAPGTFIGPYKLLQLIGEGGMGAVYMAEQEKPVRRRVALKIIKPGMDSAQVIARFEAERQALAMMDHQSIARVFDAGTTESGRPYFVMELVQGVAITQYCDNAQLNPRERLELFVPVCHAIQHAHQKGIIHRDIKPSNVLVSRCDGKPVPKVIDFGIAKATDQQLTDLTVSTAHGSVIGTLEYMSPEQAETSPLGIDTRSDIYSLGVVLYELLTNSTPLERRRLQDASYVEILTRIKDEEPPNPSTRLGGSKATLESISALRGTEPAKLVKFLRGELDWIVMKALEKDRSRRYESASSLAHDIENFLNDEPVEACPPSASYRLKKFARKHRAALATALAFAAILVLGVVASTWQAIRATQSETRAKLAAKRANAAEERSRLERDRAIEAEGQAKAEGEKAKRSAAEAQAVLSFFQDQVLAAARPQGQEGGLGRDVSIRRAVEVAEPAITPAFSGQPTVEASVRNVLGQTYSYLGELTPAVEQLQRALELRKTALGADHVETLSSQNNLASAYVAAGRLDRAIPLFERTVESRTATLGANHPDTLVTQNNFALALRDAGQWHRAIPLFERTLAAETATLGADNPRTLLTQNNLALTYRDDGQWDRAIALFEQTLKTRSAKLGPEHPDTLLTQHNLAMAFREAGQWDRAIPLLEQTLASQVAQLGPDHPFTLLTQSNLGPAYLAVGQVDRAIALLETTRAARAAKLGVDHPSTLTSQNNLALAYLAAGRSQEGIALLEATLAARTAKIGADHPATLNTRYELASAFQAEGQARRAESIFRDVLDARQQKLGAEHPDVAQVLSALGANLIEQEKWPEAERLLRESLAIWEAQRPDDWSRFDTESRLGASLLGQRRYAEAEPLLLSAYQGLNVRESRLSRSNKPRLAAALHRLVQLYTAQERPAEANRWQQLLDEYQASAGAAQVLSTKP
jgi:eukaryotic-like serine/threonine-protein kinase